MTINKRYLIEYELEAHGVFDNAESLNFKHPRLDVEIVLKEKLIDLSKEDVLLSAFVIFMTVSMDAANIEGDKLLSEFVDNLTFITSMKFRISKKIRIIDWTVDVENREYWIINQFPGDERPYEILSPEVIDTVQVFLSKELPIPVRKAIKWFATGISANFMDSKFQSFWFAMELLAQFVKPADKVNDRCAKCREPLYCEKCKNYPRHRPYPKQAVQYLFSKVIKGDDGEAFRICDKVRNCLLHGGDIESVEEEVNREFGEVVDIAGRAAWYAIWNVMKRLLADTGPHDNLKLFQTNTFPEIIGYHTTYLSYKCSNPENPIIGEWPLPEITIERGPGEQQT